MCGTKQVIFLAALGAIALVSGLARAEGRLPL